MRKFFAALYILIYALCFAGNALASECKVTILHFNDLHGSLAVPKKGLGGAARLAALIGNIEAENDKAGRKTLLLFAGDLISGTPVSEKYKGEAEFKFLDAIGTSAMVLGNHDFDYGAAALKKNMESTPHVPVLSANITDKATKHYFATPTYVFPLGEGCRVGIIGLTSPKTKTMTAGDISGLEFDDPIQKAEDNIDDTVEQSEARIALVHLGVDEEVKLAERVKEFDVVVGGHDHVPPEKYCRTVKSTPVCETPPNGTYLGRIDLDIKNGKVTIEKTELIPVKKGKLKEIDKLLEKYLSVVELEMSQVVGTLDRDLYYRSKGKVGAQNRLGNFVADAFRWAGGSDAAFMNLMGMRRDLKKGKVTMGDVSLALPFKDDVGNLYLTGGDIIKIIDRSGNGRDFLYWSGLEYERSAGKYSVKVNGKSLDKGAKYKVATVGFLAGGGSGYSMLKTKRFENIGKLSREVLADYVKSGKGNLL